MATELKFVKAATVRALRTFFQTLASGLTVGASLGSIDWVNVISVSTVAFIASFATSLATGLPEVDLND